MGLEERCDDADLSNHERTNQNGTHLYTMYGDRVNLAHSSQQIVNSNLDILNNHESCAIKARHDTTSNGSFLLPTTLN